MFDPYEIRKTPQERPWYRPALDMIKHVPAGKALDLGCGLAEFSQKLKQKGFEVTCVDGSEKYVQNAHELGFKALRHDFNEPFPFEDEEFDLVVSL